MAALLGRGEAVLLPFGPKKTGGPFGWRISSGAAGAPVLVVPGPWGLLGVFRVQGLRGQGASFLGV